VVGVQETNARHRPLGYRRRVTRSRITTQLSKRGSCIGDQAYRHRRSRFCLRSLAGDGTKAIYNVCRMPAKEPRLLQQQQQQQQQH